MSVIEIKDIPQKRYKIKYPCENSTNCHHLKLNFNKGTYRIELWGAGSSGGGGYTSGEIHFYEKTSLFLFIGGVGEDLGLLRGIGGYNGGGNSTHIGVYNGKVRQKGGDGATDIRTTIDDLESRIMVAGGAGAGFTTISDITGELTSCMGGHGGGLVGGDGMGNKNSIKGKGGNQTQGGSGHHTGSFGNGAISAPGTSTDLAGAGGGGYYGGGSGFSADNYGAGGGGSSYINGYPGCAFNESRISFHNTKMIPGNESMPYINGVYKKGPFGNGFAKITCIDPLLTCRKSLGFFHSHNFVAIILCYSS